MASALDKEKRDDVNDHFQTGDKSDVEDHFAGLDDTNVRPVVMIISNIFLIKYTASGL
jgi:hypothetical protein